MKLFLTTFLVCTISLSSFGQECLNVDFKVRGYFYVGSSIEDTKAPGGFYEDANVPKLVNRTVSQLSDDESFELFVKTDSLVEFHEGIKAFKVFIINQTDTIVSLPAQDSRLYLKRQVYFKDEWQDVEYLPSSWCGNSYHRVFIKPKEFWDLSAPCFDGKIKAKFRFELYVHDGLTLYSNEFGGAFNKKQLTKEQGHKPIGFMDPYNN